MTIEIQMPPELERQLQQAAEQTGVTPNVYVVHLLQQDLKQSHNKISSNPMTAFKDYLVIKLNSFSELIAACLLLSGNTIMNFGKNAALSY